MWPSRSEEIEIDVPVEVEPSGVSVRFLRDDMPRVKGQTVLVSSAEAEKLVDRQGVAERV